MATTDNTPSIGGHIPCAQCAEKDEEIRELKQDKRNQQELIKHLQTSVQEKEESTPARSVSHRVGK